MELYKTVARDRVERGKEELKLICLANAVNVFNYTFDVLEVTDVVGGNVWLNIRNVYTWKTEASL